MNLLVLSAMQTFVALSPSLHWQPRRPNPDRFRQREERYIKGLRPALLPDREPLETDDARLCRFIVVGSTFGNFAR